MNLKEIFEDALPVISAVAPTVASALGGPLGIATGYIIPVLASAFDGNSADLQGLSTKIANDSEAKTKLQMIENNHGQIISSLSKFVNNLDNAEVSIKLSWK